MTKSGPSGIGQFLDRTIDSTIGSEGLCAFSRLANPIKI